MTPIRPLEPDEIAQLTAEELAQLQDDLEGLLRAEAKKSFERFVAQVAIPGTPSDEGDDPEILYPEKLIPAAHHKLIIHAIQRIVDGEDADVDGVMIFMPPGSAKSSFASVAAPAWLLGRTKDTSIIVATYGQDLANRFGRRVRHIARSPEFSEIMGCTITGDNQAVDDWSLTNGSTYRAVGIGGGITGLRGDWIIIDDPVKNREDADSQVIRDKTWNSFNDDLTSRYRPGMHILLIMTRWHEDDLAGRLLGENWKGQSGLWRGTDERLWNIINLPMIAEHADDPLGRKVGEQLWEEYFVKKDFERLQRAAAKGGTAARTWASLYQQRPAPSEGSILLRSYWREWTKKKTEINPDGTTRMVPDPPDCDFVFLSYDTAFEDGEENDFSAMTAWGVFEHISKKGTGEEYEHMHAILLGAWEDKVQAADLAEIVVEHHRVMKPSLILIEKRASGIQLAQELRRRRLPVKTWPPKGVPMKAKVPRAHAVAMMLEQGSVHYVPGSKTQRVIDQCAAFPNGTNDDLTDTVTQALKFMRDRAMFQTADDEADSDEIKDIMNARFDARKNRPPRRGYGYTGDPQRLAQNERKDDDALVRNMTEGTRKRLYGGNL